MCQKLNENSLTSSTPSFKLISEARTHLLSKKSANISTQASLLFIFALLISLISGGKFVRRLFNFSKHPQQRCRQISQRYGWRMENVLNLEYKNANNTWQTFANCYSPDSSCLNDG